MKKIILIFFALCFSLSAYCQSLEKSIYNTYEPKVTIEFPNDSENNIEIKDEYANDIHLDISGLFFIPGIDSILYDLVRKIYNGKHEFHYNGVTFIFNPNTNIHIVKTKDFVITFYYFNLGDMADASLMVH